jgi:hypothetical protein
VCREPGFADLKVKRPAHIVVFAMPRRTCHWIVLVAVVVIVLAVTLAPIAGALGKKDHAGAGWWWTQSAAQDAVSVHGASGGLLSPIYWEYGCSGVGAHRFYNVRQNVVQPNGKSPETWYPDGLTDGLHQWKFRTFLCVVNRHSEAPLVFWLTTGAGEFDFTIRPIHSTPETLTRSYTW